MATAEANAGAAQASPGNTTGPVTAANTSVTQAINPGDGEALNEGVRNPVDADPDKPVQDAKADVSKRDAEQTDASLALALRFHETYERLAPSFGYETRDDTKNFDPNSKNGRLMVAVCGELAADKPVQDASTDTSQRIDAEFTDLRAQLDVANREANEWHTKLDLLIEAINANDLHHGTPGDAIDVAIARLNDHRNLLDQVAANPLPTAPADAGAEPLSFGGRKLEVEDLWQAVRAGPTYIIPGTSTRAIGELSPHVAKPTDWERLGSRVLYTGAFGITGIGQGHGLIITHFGLAGSPDGPVGAVCELGSPATLTEGGTFSFPRGSVVFG